MRFLIVVVSNVEVFDTVQRIMDSIDKDVVLIVEPDDLRVVADYHSELAVGTDIESISHSEIITKVKVDKEKVLKSDKAVYEDRVSGYLDEYSYNGKFIKVKLDAYGELYSFVIQGLYVTTKVNLSS